MHATRLGLPLTELLYIAGSILEGTLVCGGFSVALCAASLRGLVGCVHLRKAEFQWN
jgi:hypothetical protein